MVNCLFCACICVLTDEDWLLSSKDLEFGQKLGHGASAKVFRGMYKQRDVAIKVFKSLSSEQVDEFKKEMTIFRFHRAFSSVLFSSRV
jgi:hypothetical protein